MKFVKFATLDANIEREDIILRGTVKGMCFFHTIRDACILAKMNVTFFQNLRLGDSTYPATRL